jgi:hypothetical protein
MRSSVYPLLLSAIVALSWTAPTLAHPGHHAQRSHPPVARALLRAERLDARLDRRAAHAYHHGQYRRAYVLDRRGDRIVARAERRLHWAQAKAQDRRAARYPRG